MAKRIVHRRLKPVTHSRGSSCFHCTPPSPSTLHPSPREPRTTPICDNCVRLFQKILHSSNWRNVVRYSYFSQNRYCIHCPPYSFVKATDIDHIKPWRFYPELFWDQSNWQPLCHSCHSRKTVGEFSFKKIL